MIVIALYIVSFTNCNLHSFSKRDDCISKFQYFAMQSRPVYLKSNGIAAIPLPHKSINNCILEIHKKDTVFEQIKEYAFLVIMKVLLERLRKVKSDYTMFSENNNYENVVERICLEEMGQKKYDSNRDFYEIKLGSVFSYIVVSKQIKLKSLQDVLEEIKIEYAK
jgi:hypothetical protein